MRNKYIVGNWKMNHSNQDTKSFFQKLVPFAKVAGDHHVQLGIAPSYLSLATAAQFANHQIKVLAQNCHALPKGAYTGEVSIPMLIEQGIDGVIVGHSERRQYYKETSQGCNEKIKALLAANLQPLYCVGETLQQYERRETLAVIEQQLHEGLAMIPADQIAKIVFAYEPVWSIGTGKNASVEIAQTVCQAMRSMIAKLSNQAIADQVIIQYGGSVKPENSLAYLSAPDIDGVLVGGASLAPDSFQTLVESLWKK